MSVSSPKFDLARFRELLITAIIMHDLPLQFVEYVGIRAIFAYLSDYVKHITSNTAKAEMIKMHKREKERMTSMLNLAPGQTSLTSSSWTSITTDGHMCLTAQFIDRNLVLHKRVLNFCFCHHHIMIYLCLTNSRKWYMSGASRIGFFQCPWIMQIMLRSMMFLLIGWEPFLIIKKALVWWWVFSSSLLGSCSQFVSTRWFERDWYCCPKNSWKHLVKDCKRGNINFWITSTKCLWMVRKALDKMYLLDGIMHFICLRALSFIDVLCIS